MSLQLEGEGLVTMGGIATKAACAFVGTSVIRSSNELSEHISLISRRQGPFSPPCLPQVVCKLLRNTCTVACHWLRVENGYLLRAEIEHSLNSKPSSGSCKPSADPRVPNSYIRQILRVQLLSKQGDRFLVLLILPSSQNSLPAVIGICYFINLKAFIMYKNSFSKTQQSQELTGNLFYLFVFFVYTMNNNIWGKNVKLFTQL